MTADEMKWALDVVKSEYRGQHPDGNFTTVWNVVLGKMKERGVSADPSEHMTLTASLRGWIKNGPSED